MEFTSVQIINFLMGSGGLLGVLVIIFRVGKLVQKIEHMDERIEHLDNKIDSVNKNLSEKIDDFQANTNERLSALEKGQTEMRVQLGKLETRVEERTLRVIHTTKEIKPDPFHLGDITLQQEKVIKNAPTAV